jgi:hypothetical protein
VPQLPLCAGRFTSPAIVAEMQDAVKLGEFRTFLELETAADMSPQLYETFFTIKFAEAG